MSLFPSFSVARSLSKRYNAPLHGTISVMCVAAPPITPLFTAPPCHAPTPAAPPPPRPPVYGENKRRVSNLVMGVCDALSVGARRRRAKALQYLKVLKISILCIHIFPYLTPDFQYTTLILDPQVNRPLRVSVRQLPRAPSAFCVCSPAVSRWEHLQTCPHSEQLNEHNKQQHQPGT